MRLISSGAQSWNRSPRNSTPKSALPAASARERSDSQHRFHQRGFVRRGERLQVARAAGAVRKMVHGLRPVPPLAVGEGRGVLRPRQHQRRGTSRRHRSAKDERAAKHRQVAQRVVCEDPHGLRKRPAGSDFPPVRRECPRRARRPRLAGKLKQSGRERAAGDGPRQRGRQDPRPRRDLGDDTDRAAEGEQESRTGLRPGNLQAS